MIHGKNLKLDLLLLEKLVQADLDANIIIFGGVGSGKSTLALNIARFLDKDFSVEQIAMNLKSFAKIVKKKPKVVIIDENFFRKRGKQTKLNLILTDFFDRIRAINTIYIWCVPTFSELDAYMRWERTRTSITTLFLSTKVTITEKLTVERYGEAWRKTDVLQRLRELIYGKFNSDLYIKPLYTFRWDFRGIEDLLLAYRKLKDESVDDAIDQLITIATMSEQVIAKEEIDPEYTYYSTSDIAAMYNISPITVANWIRSGKLKAIKVGKNYKVREDWLEEFREQYGI